MIRLAKEVDIETIVSLEQLTLNTTLGYDMLHDYLTNTLAKILVLEQDSKVIGYASMVFDGSVVEILNICIHPFYQGKGLGKKLLGYIIREYNFLADSFFLEVRESNIYARKLYEYFDFKIIHTRKNYYNEENALVYERQTFKYIDLFKQLKKRICSVEIFDDIEKYYNVNNPTRYDDNFYLVAKGLKDEYENIMKHHMNLNQRHLSIVSFDEPMEIDGMEISSDVVMYGVINQINVLKKSMYQAVLFDNTYIDLIAKYVYNRDVVCDKTYAFDNRRETLKLFTSGIYKLFGVVVDNNIIGFACCSVFNKTLYFEDFVVDKSHQHKGIGSAIFNCVIEYAKKNGVYDMYLLADNNDTYKDMYEKMGFIHGNITTVYNGDINGKDKCDSNG